MKKLFAVLSVLAISAILAGCATQQYYAGAVNSWQGASQNELYHVWGYPNRVNKLPNGHKVLVYRYKERVREPMYSTPAATTVIRTRHRTRIIHTDTTYSGGRSYDLRCTTWFELGKHGRVVNTSFRGNDCVATKQFMMMHSYQGY